jgi:predicted Rdx family selenoprotein
VVNTPRYALSLLLLTEDSGAQAHATLEALCKKMLQLVSPGCSTHRIQFLPMDEETRAATRGKAHAARTPKGELKRHLLASKIAVQLLRQDRPGFTGYHADADRVWSQRSDRDFPDYDKLRELVRQRLVQPQRAVPLPPDARERIERFFLLGAYWEIESWLYQNTDVAIRLCEEHDAGRHVALFRQWATERHTLDEQTNTKDSTCLRDQHNHTLATTAYPAEAAHAAGTSFAQAVETLRRCPALIEALARTQS